MYLLKINFYLFNAFWGYFIFLLLVVHKFLEASRRFTFENDSDIRDSDVRGAVVDRN